MQTQERIVKLFGADGFANWHQPASVSVGWRHSSKRQLALCLGFNPRLMSNMNWLPKEKLSVRLDYEANEIILTRDAAGNGYIRGNSKRIAVELRVPELNITSIKPAKPMAHKVKGASLIVKMPEWLAAKTQPVVIPAPVQAVPAPVVAKPKPTPQPYIGIMNRTVDPAAVARGKR